MPDNQLSLKQKYFNLKAIEWDKATREKLIEDFTYHSTKIEGLQLNYGETIEFLRSGIVKKNTGLKDISDLSNHREVLKMVFASYNDLALNNSTICLIHGILMKDRAQWGGYDVIIGGPGKFKFENNFGLRGDGSYKEYMDWERAPIELEHLCKQTNEQLHSGKSVDTEIINRFHYLFINEIHPFGDGNGRMARLLHNLLLLKKGYPVVVIKDDQKHTYITALIEQERNPKGNAFNKFMDEQLEVAIENAIAKRKDGNN